VHSSHRRSPSLTLALLDITCGRAVTASDRRVPSVTTLTLGRQFFVCAAAAMRQSCLSIVRL